MRRVLVVVAALPVLQLSQCQAAILQPLGNLSNSVPSILFNSFISAFFNTMLEALGAALAGATA
jgi:hypothetical protein